MTDTHREEAERLLDSHSTAPSRDLMARAEVHALLALVDEIERWRQQAGAR